jgi:hypothetical protein
MPNGQNEITKVKTQKKGDKRPLQDDIKLPDITQKSSVKLKGALLRNKEGFKVNSKLNSFMLILDTVAELIALCSPQA